MKALLAVFLLGTVPAQTVGAQEIEGLPGMPGDLSWGSGEEAVIGALGDADEREELPVRGVIRLSYAADDVLPGATVSYDFAPRRGLAKGDYVFNVTGDCEEAYEAVAQALGPPFVGKDDLNFCRLPASMPFASRKDAAGAELGVMMDPRSGKVIITYESPFYSSFITGGRRN